VSATDGESADSTAVQRVLLVAREAGFLGPGPIERHLVHAEGFVSLARAQSGPRAVRLLDLGSGGGLPGLVIAAEWAESNLVLLEANERRAQFLERAVFSCGLQRRVTVVHQRAEITGRDPLYRGAFDGVVVRSFGPPAVVAECAAPFLRVGGWLIVSEPPSHDMGGSECSALTSAADVDFGGGLSRWPEDQLARVGLEPVEQVRLDFGYQILRQYERCPDRYPRRDGVPARRPLF
jgi:16S rRNA (guanine527-N7)-methyltransferase